MNAEGKMDVVSENPLEPSVMLLDSFNIDYVDLSKYENERRHPRQSVALTGIKLHFLIQGMSYDAPKHEVISGSIPGPVCGVSSFTPFYPL